MVVERLALRMYKRSKSLNNIERDESFDKPSYLIQQQEEFRQKLSLWSRREQLKSREKEGSYLTNYLTWSEVDSALHLTKMIITHQLG